MSSGLSLDSDRQRRYGEVADERGVDDADMIGAVAIGHRTRPNDAYRLIWDWGQCLVILTVEDNSKKIHEGV